MQRQKMLVCNLKKKEKKSPSSKGWDMRGHFEAKQVICQLLFLLFNRGIPCITTGSVSQNLTFSDAKDRGTQTSWRQTTGTLVSRTDQLNILRVLWAFSWSNTTGISAMMHWIFEVNYMLRNNRSASENVLKKIMWISFHIIIILFWKSVEEKLNGDKTSFYLRLHWCTQRKGEMGTNDTRR